MALTIEDGSVVAGADSYVSLAAAATYAASHPGTNATAYLALATDALREGALRYATTWVDNRYNWPGGIVDEDQVLMWPRAGAYDSQGRSIDTDEIPQALKDAVCEAAFAHVGEPLNEILKRGGMITAEGIGSMYREYSPGAPPGRTFQFIDGILAKLAGPFNSAIRTMVRA